MPRSFLFRSAQAALLCLSLLGLARAESAPLAMGSVAMEAPTAMIARMSPLTSYLSTSIGSRVDFKPAPNLEAAVQDLLSGATAIAYLTPAAYIEARSKLNVIPLAAPLTKGHKSFTLVIAARQDSPLRSCKDLSGKSFAFGDKKAHVQAGVVDSCLGSTSKLGKVDYLKHYDNIAKALLMGDFDAGILKDTVFDEFAPKGLRKLHESEPLAGYIIVASPTLSAETRSKLQKALLSMRSGDAASEAALATLDKGYTGFALVEDREYDSLRALIARVKKDHSDKR